jgi:solute:Na+ symporter, SSS family
MALASRIDLFIIAIYMILMICVGVLLSRFNKSDSDFFKSGNKMTWWLSGFSMFMTSFSVYTFTGGAGLAYRAPSVALLMYFCNALVLIPITWFLASRWRRTRSATSMSYLSERYGVSTNQLYSWSHLGVAIVQGGVQLLALGKFVSVALGTPLASTIMVCGLVIAIYCLIGGLWAVVVTDTLQFMVLFPCALVVLFLGLYELGDISRLVTEAPAGLWEIKTQEFDWFYLLAYMVMMFFAMSSGSAAQRFFSVKDEKDARKVALLTMILLAIAPIIWLTPPIITRIMDIDLTSITVGLNAPQEAAYVAFCMKFLPAGAMGIMLSAMLAATMSSLSSAFNNYAAVITDDIIRQIFWKTASKKQLLLIGRIVTLVLGALVVVAAIIQASVKGGVFLLMMTIGGVVIVPAGVPIVCGLFYRNTPSWAGLASYGSGLFVGILFLILGKDITFTQQVFAVGGFSALVYFVPGFFIKAEGKYKNALDSFFTKVTTPVAAEEVGDTDYTDVGSYRITGWTTVGMGIAVMFMFFLDLDMKGRLINLSIGALIALFGLFLILACSYAQRKKMKRRMLETGGAQSDQA